jgi:hypothetical protein
MVGRIHKIAVLISREGIMGPERVVESVITRMFIRVLGIEETSHISDHVNAELAIESRFALIKWTHSHSYFYAH